MLIVSQMMTQWSADVPVLLISTPSPLVMVPVQQAVQPEPRQFRGNIERLLSYFSLDHDDGIINNRSSRESILLTVY